MWKTRDYRISSGSILRTLSNRARKSSSIKARVSTGIRFSTSLSEGSGSPSSAKLALSSIGSASPNSCSLSGPDSSTGDESSSSILGAFLSIVWLSPSPAELENACSETEGLGAKTFFFRREADQQFPRSRESTRRWLAPDTLPTL